MSTQALQPLNILFTFVVGTLLTTDYCLCAVFSLGGNITVRWSQTCVCACVVCICVYVCLCVSCVYLCECVCVCAYCVRAHIYSYIPSLENALKLQKEYKELYGSL